MSDYPEVTIAYVCLRARCPRCGKGSLFKTFLTVAGNCNICGLSFQGHEQGDGPAFFCICIIGTFTGIFAAVTEVIFEPPYWLHAAIWIPFVILTSLISLRAMKAALIAMQYKFRPEDFVDK